MSSILLLAGLLSLAACLLLASCIEICFDALFVKDLNGTSKSNSTFFKFSLEFVQLLYLLLKKIIADASQNNSQDDVRFKEH